MWYAVELTGRQAVPAIYMLDSPTHLRNIYIYTEQQVHNIIATRKVTNSDTQHHNYTIKYSEKC